VDGPVTLSGGNVDESVSSGENIDGPVSSSGENVDGSVLLSGENVDGCLTR
jgi:hypothetical protein